MEAGGRPVEDQRSVAEFPADRILGALPVEIADGLPETLVVRGEVVGLPEDFPKRVFFVFAGINPVFHWGNGRYHGLPSRRQLEMPAESFVNHPRAVDLAVETVAGNVRRAEVHHVEQLRRNVRFVFPDIEDGGRDPVAVNRLEQRFVVHDGAARRVEEREPFEVVVMEQMPGRVIERDVKCDDVGFQGRFV